MLEALRCLDARALGALGGASRAAHAYARFPELWKALVLSRLDDAGYLAPPARARARAPRGGRRRYMY